MRILVAHNTYQHKGGEDRVVEQEIALLRKAGHTVELFGADNHAIQGVARKVKVLIETPHSPSSKQRMAEAIKAFKPDVVHVHNTFPLLTPSIYQACSEAGVKVVQTLHNFRITCANGLLLRNGKPCETCVEGSPWWGAVRRCYRGSLPGSAAVANLITTHKRKGTWHREIDTFIALSPFSRDVFIRAGVPAEKIVVKPNCVEDPLLLVQPSKTPRQGALFVGRLSEEKGVRALLNIWDGLDVPLKIIGDGPLRAEVDAVAQRNPAIEVCGFQSAPAIYAAMQQAQVLVLPSICYENFPVSLAEAYASQLPVVASRIGSLESLVGQNEGWLVAPDDVQGWRNILTSLTADEVKKRGQSARKVYEAAYTPEANLKQLEAIYAAA